MSLKNQLLQLANEKGKPCVTISFNTHRQLPDSLKDPIKLKNFVKEAEDRLLKEYEKREVTNILKELETLESRFDVAENLESLNIFISNDTFEVIRTHWKVEIEGVWLDDSFNINALIKEINRTEEYLVLYVAQSGIHLYLVLNDSIVKEIKNEYFPFTERKHNLRHLFSEIKDSSIRLNKFKELFNQVDKALYHVNSFSGDILPCLVVTTQENYSTLLQVADYPHLYVGSVSIDFNAPNQTHEFINAAWDFMKERQKENRLKAVEEIKEAIGKGQVTTDLQEIYQAAIDGNGELLIVYKDFQQPVKFIDDRTFVLVDDSTENGVLDDITSTLAWEVLSKKGRVIFTNQDEIQEIGDIVLKKRY